MRVWMRDVRQGFRPVTMSLLALFLYFLISFLLSRFGLSAGPSVFLADSISAVWLYLWYRKIAPQPYQEDYRLSGFGWFLVGVLFVALYLTSQGAGTYLQQQYAKNYLELYGQMQSSVSDLGFYMLASVTAAPIAEELLFRGFCYRCVNRCYKRWVSVLFSCLLFACIHGTVAHLPIAVGLTVFLCFLYDVTGKLWICILFHSLYNLFGVTLLIPVPVTGTVWLLLFTVCLAVLLVCYGQAFWFASKFEKNVFPNLTACVKQKRDAWIAKSLRSLDHDD